MIQIYGKGYIDFSKSLFQICEFFSNKGVIFMLYLIINKLNVSKDQPTHSQYYIDFDSSQVIQTHQNLSFKDGSVLWSITKD